MTLSNGQALKCGVKTDGGAEAGPAVTVLAELAGLIADGNLEVPIAHVYPAGTGPRGLHRARTPPQSRQDRPQVLMVTAVGPAGTGR